MHTPIAAIVRAVLTRENRRGPSTGEIIVGLRVASNHAAGTASLVAAAPLAIP
jgi:hypothetical protein